MASHPGACAVHLSVDHVPAHAHRRDFVRDQFCARFAGKVEHDGIVRDCRHLHCVDVCPAAAVRNRCSVFRPVELHRVL
jgi:hypothetical protein